MPKLDSQFLSPSGEHTNTDTTPAQASSAQPAADDTRYLDQLAELWAGHRRCDLSVRYQTGVLLNNKFGAPTTRQKRGAGELKDASMRSGQSVSDLSRMRNFAYHFKSFDEFVRKHENMTWTEVKTLLPTLKGGDTLEREGEARPGKNAKRTVSRCRKRLVTLTRLLKPVEANDLTRGLAKEWRDSLAAFAEVISAKFGIVVTVGGVREESESEDVCAAATAG
jgi:hypothetical protein